MLKIAGWLMILSIAAYGYAFMDNGSGGVDDTVVITFNIWNSDGTNLSADFDSVWIAQAYKGTVFNSAKLSVPENYDIGSSFPFTACFEYRAKAANSSGDLGLYTYWAVGFGSDGAHTVAKGCYYVNNVGIGEMTDTIMALIDSIQNQDNQYVILRDSLFAVLDSLQRLNTAYTNTRAAYLDAAISSRSTLTASDNIGINWADISNPTTTVNLSGTTINLVNTTTSVTNNVNTTWGVNDIWHYDLSSDDNLDMPGGRLNLYLDKAVGAIDDNPWDNPKSDTAAGMGDWQADWFHDFNDDSLGGVSGGADTSAIKTMMLNNGFARKYTSGGGADTVYVKNAGTPVVDTAAIARSVWDDDVVSQRIVNEVKSGVQIADDATPDSLWRRLEQLRGLIGYPNSTPQWDTIGGNIQDKLGAFIGNGTDNLKSNLDTLQAYVGKHGISTPQVSLHMKLGDYSGAAGDNVKTEKYSGAKFDSTYYDSIGLHATGADSIITVMNLPDSVVRRIDSLKFAWFGWAAYPETIVVLDSESQAAIAGARIRVNLLDGRTTRVVNAPTDINGRRLLYLDSTSYLVVAAADGFKQIIDTISVGAEGGSDTLCLERFDPGHPPQADLCRVYGWIYDISGGRAKNAEIAVEIPRQYHPVKYGDVVITPFNRSVFSDSTGYWQIDLYPNSKLTSPYSRYLFTIKHGSGIVYRLEVEVPDRTSWQLQ